jgi:hypothetical protein
LSDAGSKFGDDDITSHYLGQSEYGGISNIGNLPDHNDFNQSSLPPQASKTTGSRR